MTCNFCTNEAEYRVFTQLYSLSRTGRQIPISHWGEDRTRYEFLSKDVCSECLPKLTIALKEEESANLSAAISDMYTNKDGSINRSIPTSDHSNEPTMPLDRSRGTEINGHLYYEVGAINGEPVSPIKYFDPLTRKILTATEAHSRSDSTGESG